MIYLINKIMSDIKNEVYETLVRLTFAPNDLIKSKDDLQIEIPKDKSHGDYSVNIAMQLARVLRRKPFDIANEIINNLCLDNLMVSKVEVAGAGFINLYLSLEKISQVVFLINKEQENYGNLNLGKGEKINLEFVSANPTGYLHVGHGRGAAYGDSLARLLKKAGFNVDKEHYVNDAGNQITNMAKSVYERYIELFGRPITMGEDYYYGKEIITVAEKIKTEYGDKFLDNFDLEFFKSYGTKELLSNLKKDLVSFNVNFDTWFSELSLYQTKQVEKTLQTLKDGGYTYLQDGALWLKTTDFFDEKDRVIIKNDGSYTYLLPDIAYHQNKLERGYDHLIDVLGSDHHGYIARLKSAVSMIGKNSNLIDVEILQMVRVIENGEEIKMSKRSGKAITLVDLIDEVGTDALRYFYVQKALGTHMDLDLGLMKQKSNDNPVFYCQYAYARIFNIFKNFESVSEFKEVSSFKELNLETTKNLMLCLLKYPSIIKEAAEKRLVHKVTHYIYELATYLHSYYNDEKVITDSISLTNEKLTVLKAVQIVLKDALNLVGVSAPQKM